MHTIVAKTPKMKIENFMDDLAKRWLLGVSVKAAFPRRILRVRTVF
jgi:hypothetical protein